MSNKRVVFRNIFASLLQQLIAVIYGFIVPLLIIKHYGSETNGLVSSINQFVSYIVLLELGIGPVIKAALYKPIVKNDKENMQKVLGATNSFFKKISYIFIAYLIVLCFVYPSFIEGFSSMYVISLILIISIGRFFEYFIGMTYKLFLQADQKNYVIDYTISLSYILSLAIIIIMLNINCTIHAVKLVSSIIYLIRPIILKLYFDKKYKLKIVKDKNYKLPQQWDGLFHHIASVVQSNTDIAVLTLFSSLTNVSIYSIYALVTSGIRSIIVALTNGIDAFFGKLLANDNIEQVRKNFKIYCLCFYSITTILISCSFVLVIPFINLYTKEITDANYVYPLFGYMMVLAEFMFVIRYPYSNLVYAKGHFKQTRNFSIAEPIVNLIVSIALVIKFGLVGVAIGTFISVIIRTFGFIIYGTKKILNNNLLHEMKLIIASFIELIAVCIVHLMIGNILVTSYFKWVLLGSFVFIIITAFVLLTNRILFKDTFDDLIAKLKGRKKNNE